MLTKLKCLRQLKDKRTYQELNMVKKPLHHFRNTFGVPDIDLEFIHCIHHIRKGLEAYKAVEVAQHGLSTAQVEILATISMEGSGTSTELAKCLKVSKPNLTGMIKRLEEKKLLKRAESSEDARIKIIVLTQKGETLINKIIPDFILMMSEVLSSVPESEKRSLVSNLALILDSIGEKVNGKES